MPGGWNKGLTKETDERVRKNTIGICKSISTRKRRPPHSIITKNRISEKLKGNTNAKGIRNGKSLDELFGKDKAGEIKKKMRVSAVKRIENRFGIVHPNFNLEACEFFKSFDKQHNTKGRYALSSKGEYFIEELGYFPDYFNPDLKLIIEYDELRHYKNGKLLDKDVKRQEEIMELYPDFEFIRIKEGI